MPSGCIEAKKNFLKNELGEDPMVYEVDEMTESDVNHALLEIAIDKQMRADEENKKINVLNEGSDLDGTRFEDIERQKFEFELAEMRKDGCSKKEIKEMMLRHAQLQIELKGDYLGIREMRKHVAWYTKGMEGSAKLRDEINRVESYEELEKLLNERIC